MSGDLPVVFLAFANAPDEHLATLKEESRNLFRALQPLESAGRLDIHREESSGFDEFYQDLLAYDDRIVIFHYGGHADGSMLKLEDGQGDARGISRLLGQQSSLKLVFLNGCATKDQVKLLHEAGIPAVIATAVKINDTRATHFSTAFYNALAQGQSIFESFASAQNFIEGKFGSEGETQPINRSPVYDFAEEEEPAEPFVFEWTLYVRSDVQHDLEQWRLPEAREGWRVQLEDSHGPIRSVGGEPFLLDYRSRLRSFDVACCEHCCAKIASQGDVVEPCPVCGSSVSQSEPVLAGIPQCILPVELTRHAAETIARQQLRATDSRLLDLNLVYLPYWVFDVQAQASYSAERGLLDNADTDTPRMAWSEANETFDLEIVGYGVSAGASTGGAPLVIHGERSVLDKAETLRSAVLPELSIPLEKDVGVAFTAVANFLDDELVAEGRERVGGLEQRKIVADLRYKALSVQSALVPHWYVSATSTDGEKACLAVNAQSGATHVVPTPGNKDLFNESDPNMQQQLADGDRKSRNSSTFASVFGGIGIGIMVGLLLGLAAPSAKSVVSVFIGAVGVGLAALLGLNDKHFSTAKGLRIGSFGLAVAISALSGIYVRDHGLLSPTLTDRVVEIRGIFKGIDDSDVIALMTAVTRDSDDAAADKKSGDVSVNQFAAMMGQGSYLYSGVASNQSACDRLKPLSAAGTSAKLLLNNFRVNDENKTLGWSALADRAQKTFTQEKDQKNFMLLSRDVVCGVNAFDRRVEMSKDQCQAIEEGAQSGSQLSSVFEAQPGTRELLRLVRTQITSDAQNSALVVLAPVLCNAKVKN